MSPFATANSFVLAPEDPARRVTITSSGTGTTPIGLYDGRDQAQNGWFVLRSELPSGKTGRVVEWTIQPHSVADYVRAPVIGHSQLGYAPSARKVATIELDRNDRQQLAPRLLRVQADGSTVSVKSGRVSIASGTGSS